MKAILVVVIVVGLSLESYSYPANQKVLKYKTSNKRARVDAAPVIQSTLPPLVVVPVVVNNTESVVLPNVNATQTQEVVAPEVVVKSVEPKVGEKVYGEPNKITKDSSTPSKAPELPTQAASVQTPETPAPVVPDVGPTIVPNVVDSKNVSGVVPTAVSSTNGTASEEDDSSSEEEEDDEDSDEPQLRKYNTQSMFSRRTQFGPIPVPIEIPSSLVSQFQQPIRKPNNNKNNIFNLQQVQKYNANNKNNVERTKSEGYDVIINGYVTDDGQVLVPLSSYHKYFSNINSAPPKFYAPASRQDAVSPQQLVEVSKNNEKEQSSEERVPVRISSTSVLYETEIKEKDGDKEVKTEANSNDSDSSVETSNKKEESTESETNLKAEGESNEESEKKPSSSEESPSAETSSEDKEKEVTKPVEDRVPVFRPPPLGVIPATKPTDEDDEEEAGRFLENFGFYPYEQEQDFYSYPPHQNNFYTYDY